MDPASVTAAFVFMAFAALSYIRTRSIVFCDSSTQNGDGTDSPDSKPCVPCPGRCRDGKLVACRRGYILTDQTCEPDVLFQNRVYILKNSIEKDVRERKLRSLSEVRAGKGSARDEDKLFDIALEELLAENRLVVGTEGRLYLPGLESYSGRTTESGLEFYAGPLNTLIVFVLFLISGILLLKGRPMFRQPRRRQQNSNAGSMEHILFDENLSSTPYAQSSASQVEDEMIEEQNGFFVIFEESSTGQLHNNTGIQMEGTSIAMPVTAPAENVSSSSASASSTINEESAARDQQPTQSTTIDCLLCSEKVASEALLCGHLICCESCLDSYKENMARSNNLRCPYCRKHSNGTWLHIHGLTG